MHGLGQHAFVTNNVAFLGILEKLAPTGHVIGRQARDLCLHVSVFGPCIQMRPIGPANRVERIQRLQRDLFAIYGAILWRRASAQKADLEALAAKLDKGT